MEHRNWLILAVLLAGGLFGSCLLPGTNHSIGAARLIGACMRDGARCVRRYRTLWSVLALFGFCHALFNLAVQVFFHFALPEEIRPIFQWDRAWFLPGEEMRAIAWNSLLPSAENVAGIFNNVLSTYPFSAIAGLLLLSNWEDHLLTLSKAMERRYGHWGSKLVVAICICAVAAVIKPLMYVVLPLVGSTRLDPLLVLQVSTIVEWLSFLFEYLFGVCIQLYLILLVYAWLRGLSFTHSHLLDFAIRRFGSVAKWAALVLALSSVLINLPLIASILPFVSNYFDQESVLGYIDRIARPLLALLLILFASMQITLTFHSESVRKAAADHFGFLRRNWVHLLWFLLIAGVNFYALNFFNALLLKGLGEGTAVVIFWRLLFPLANAWVAAWLLASWVCLFQRCASGRMGEENWIAF